MKRYAFIDVQNTETTTLKVLKFSIDYERLFVYLKDRWKCEKVFFYPGIHYGDSVRDELFKKLTKLGAIVRPKYYSIYKNEERVVTINCPNCYLEIKNEIDTGSSWKCNRDVELTSDVIDHSLDNPDILLFSGDGDFEFLIKKITERGCTVAIISSAKKIQKSNRYFISRLSIKLRKVTSEDGKPVRFIEIDDWKMLIKMDTLKSN